jgi:CheY-like chemotaxis protein
LRPIARRGAVFVALTGYGTDEDRRRAREAGFDEHKVKPVSLDAVRALTERVARGMALTPLH